MIVARLLSLVVLSVSLLGCDTTRTGRAVDRALEAPWPVKRAWQYGDRLSISLADQVPLGQVVDLSLFGEFRPNRTIQQTSETHGKPKSTRTDFRGTFYEYESSRARIEVAHERSGSGGHEWSQWTVYAYPTAGDAKTIFHPSIATLLHGIGVRTVVVMAQDGQRIWATVAGETVDDLRRYTVTE